MINRDSLEILINEKIVDEVIAVEEAGSTNDMAKQYVRDGFTGTALLLRNVRLRDVDVWEETGSQLPGREYGCPYFGPI